MKLCSGIDRASFQVTKTDVYLGLDRLTSNSKIGHFTRASRLSYIM